MNRQTISAAGPWGAKAKPQQKPSGKRAAAAKTHAVPDERPSKKIAACCSACKRRPGVVEWAQTENNRCSGDQCMQCFTTWTSHFAYLQWPQFCTLYSFRGGVPTQDDWQSPCRNRDLEIPILKAIICPSWIWEDERGKHTSGESQGHVKSKVHALP